MNWFKKLTSVLIVALIFTPLAANADERGSVYGNRCGDYVRTVEGVNVSRLGVKLKCPGYSKHLNGYMDSGDGVMRIYDIHRKRQGDIRHTLVHEMAHAVDFRMSDQLRYTAYEQTGALSAKGYYSTNGGKVNMKAWANDPMEVYAENISYCTLGVKKMPGIRYVKRSKCGAIMATYRKAVATGRPYRTPPAAPARAKSSTHKSVKSSHAKHSKTQVKQKSKKHSSKKHSSKKAKKHSSKKSTKHSSKKHSSKKHKKHSSKKHSAKKHVKKSRKKRGRRAEPRTYAIVPIARPSEAKVLLTHRSHLMHASFIMHTRQAESFGILDPGKFVLIVER